jgi:nucleoside-diphosphate-sugar epimerase
VVPVEADAGDVQALARAGEGVDVIMNALNPVYTQWAALAGSFTSGAIAAATASGGLLLFPGNVYNFGAGMPLCLTPGTPFAPTTGKGRIRVEIENRLQAAAASGAFKLAILRAGDFFGGSLPGSWLDLVIAKDLAKGTVVAPGPLPLAHAFAYLPDLANAFCALAEQRDRLESTSTFHFAGHGVTIGEFVEAVARAASHPVKVKALPWWAMRLMAIVSPAMRDVVEMKYLWDRPHRLEDPSFATLCGPIASTPLDAAIAASLDALNIKR